MTVATAATQPPAIGPVETHTGAVGDGQSAACVATLHARQLRVVLSHTGALPEQFALVRQPRHRCAAVSQTGVAPLQSVLAMHCATVNVLLLLFGPRPAPTATATKAVCVPTARAIVGVKLNVPAAVAVVRPISIPST